MCTNAWCQDVAVKKVKEKTKNGLIEYYVLKADKKVKHGHFEETEFSRLVRQGEYDHGKKHGEWTYYKSGKKDKSATYDQGKEIAHSEYFGDFKKAYRSIS